MNGLERITDKILTEAEASAREVLARAEADAKEIRARYGSEASALAQSLTDQAECEGAELVARAKSASAAQKGNAMLAARARLLDEVYASAQASLRDGGDEKYTAALAGLLAATMIEQLAAEQKAKENDAEEYVPTVSYEAVFSAADREKYGKAVLSDARARLAGKLPQETLSRLVLSDKTAVTGGGLILRCGDVECNCTFPLLFADLRRETEGEVSRILFDGPK